MLKNVPSDHAACVELLLAKRREHGKATDVSPKWFSIQKVAKTRTHQASQPLVQRTPEWFRFRKGRMTGSKFSNLFFTDTEKELDVLRDRIFHDGPKEKFDEASLARMNWGSQHEDHAAAEMIQAFPNLIGFESSIVAHPTVEWIAASPDGTLALLDADAGTFTHLNCEIKCPAPKEDTGKVLQKAHPHYYYMPQIHMEMVCTGTRTTIFVIWTPETTRMWAVEFDQGFHDAMVELTVAFKDKSCTFAQFMGRREYLKEWATRISNQATTLHPGKGFTSTFTKDGFKLQ